MNKFLCTKLHTIATFGVGFAACVASPRDASGDGVRVVVDPGVERWLLDDDEEQEDEDEEEKRFGEEDDDKEEDEEEYEDRAEVGAEMEDEM